MGPKSLGPNNFWVENFWGEVNVWSKSFMANRKLVQNFFWPKTVFFPKILFIDILDSKKALCPKNIGPEKVSKLYKNRICISRYITLYWDLVNCSRTNIPNDINGLTIQSSTFGSVLTGSIRDKASYLLVNYRDPNNKSNKNFAKPVLNCSRRLKFDLAIWLASCVAV